MLNCCLTMNFHEVFMLNNDNVCRTCLKCLNTGTQVNINDLAAFKDNPDRKIVLAQIFNGLSIKLFDDDPSIQRYICTSCDAQIQSALTFIEMCLQSDQILNQNIIKTEVNEEVWLMSNAGNDEEKVVEENGFDSEKEIKCDTDLSDDEPLIKLKKENVPSKKYSCPHCPRTFKGMGFLLNHSYKHTETLPHECKLCLEKFLNHRTLAKHVANVHQKKSKSEMSPDILKPKIGDGNCPDANLCCLICREEFADYSNFKKHSAQHEKESKDNHTCLLCSESFSTRILLAKHREAYHNKKHVCFCGESYNRNSKLVAHILEVHEKIEVRRYACEVCDKKFRSPYLLDSHRNVHLGIKPYLCSVCPRAYTSSNNLLFHQKQHTNGVRKKKSPNKFLCDNCGEGFSRKGHLHRHIARKHTLNPSKNFECDLCGRAFLERSMLKSHLRIHTGIRPFSCQTCKRSFLTSWRLQYHIDRVHKNLRPYPCTTCDHSFKTKAHMVKHMRTHTGEKPFPCPHCPYHCAEKSNLAKHIRIHTRGR